MIHLLSYSALGQVGSVGYNGICLISRSLVACSIGLESIYNTYIRKVDDDSQGIFNSKRNMCRIKESYKQTK